MSDAYAFVSLVEAGIGVWCLVVAAFAWPYRQQAAGTPLVALGLAAAGWAFTAAVASLVADPGVTRAAQYGTYVTGGVAAVAWFYLVVEYASRTEWTGRPTDVGLAGLVGLDVACLVTNGWHGLYVTPASEVTAAGLFDPSPGPLLWLNFGWKAGLILLGVAVLVRPNTERPGIIGLQSTAVLVTGLLPLATAVVELLDLVSVPGFDVGVVGVALGSALVLWALFYADFLDVVPIARKTMFESMADAVVAVDTGGRVVDLNRRARLLFGVGEDVVGTPATTALAALPELVEDGEISSKPVELVADIDGETRYYEFKSTPIESDDGRPWRAADDGTLGRLLVFRDVTRSKQHERNVERKNARLEEFASVVSHDLRNPLNVAQGRIDLVRETADDENLSKAAEALDRMETLIEEVLLLAREGRTVERGEAVDIEALVTECWANVVTGDATLVVADGGTIRGDRSRLQALFENLFRNSVKHGSTNNRASSDGSVEHGTEDSQSPVTITVGTLPSGFYVADDGVGIPPDDREVVFESGYSTASDGNGLGLAIVSVIAEAHGWTVEVTESEAGGARFEFTGVTFES